MTIKRFIAGAVCQACGQQDKVRAWDDPNAQAMYRECVACGYTDVLAHASEHTSELLTRVNYTDPVFDEDVSPVRILDPRSMH
ncbi:MAG: YheV family putative metal-binding protein [Gammaproteobacteria bacterium]|nr:YheV family putative metal-binding protein [Gammaproteobacteria bacterium]